MERPLICLRRLGPSTPKKRRSNAAAYRKLSPRIERPLRPRGLSGDVVSYLQQARLLDGAARFGRKVWATARSPGCPSLKLSPGEPFCALYIPTNDQKEKEDLPSTEGFKFCPWNRSVLLRASAPGDQFPALSGVPGSASAPQIKAMKKKQSPKALRASSPISRELAAFRPVRFPISMPTHSANHRGSGHGSVTTSLQYPPNSGSRSRSALVGRLRKGMWTRLPVFERVKGFKIRFSEFLPTRQPRVCSSRDVKERA